jgi:hypothetical protein
MLFRDDVPAPPTGHFICRTYRDGKLIELIDEPNLVVNEWAVICANALGGAAGYGVTQMGWGTNGATPLPTDTALTAPYYNAFGSVTYPSAGLVQYNFQLGTAEANGLSIQEFGLVTTNGLLFAHKVRLAPLVKASDITLSGSWVITF